MGQTGATMKLRTRNGPSRPPLHYALATFIFFVNSAAGANTLTQSQTGSGPLHSGIAFSFAQFDPASGTLNSVDLTWSGSFSTPAIATNAGTVPVDELATEIITYELTFESYYTPGWVLYGDGSTVFANGGPHIALEPNQSESVSFNVSFGPILTPTYSAVLDPFFGEGLLTLTLLTATDVFEVGPLALVTQETTTTAVVNLTYNYMPAAVPVTCPLPISSS